MSQVFKIRLNDDLSLEIRKLVQDSGLTQSQILQALVQTGLWQFQDGHLLVLPNGKSLFDGRSFGESLKVLQL